MRVTFDGKSILLGTVVGFCICKYMTMKLLAKIVNENAQKQQTEQEA